MNMKALFLLVQLTLEQIVVNASDDLVFELSDVIDAQLLADILVTQESILGRHVNDGDHFELLNLSRLEVQVLGFVGIVLGNCFIGE